MSRQLVRALAGCAVTAVCLLTASCGGSDDASPTTPASSAAADTQTVTSSGFAFDVPTDFSEIDASDVDGDDSTYADLADRLGVTIEQFDQAIQAVDLFLFSDDGPKDGFLDNINVIEQQGELPGDDELEAQFGQLGATGIEIEHSDTDAGEVADITYDLEVSGQQVAGRGMLLSTDDGSVVTITVSAGERDTADQIGGVIVDTLAPAS